MFTIHLASISVRSNRFADFPMTFTVCGMSPGVSVLHSLLFSCARGDTWSTFYGWRSSEAGGASSLNYNRSRNYWPADRLAAPIQIRSHHPWWCHRGYIIIRQWKVSVCKSVIVHPLPNDGSAQIANIFCSVRSQKVSIVSIWAPIEITRSLRIDFYLVSRHRGDRTTVSVKCEALKIWCNAMRGDLFPDPKLVSTVVFQVTRECCDRSRYVAIDYQILNHTNWIWL